MIKLFCHKKVTSSHQESLPPCNKSEINSGNSKPILELYQIFIKQELYIMNKSQALKMGLDVILVFLLLILMDTSITGTNLHEWIGFGIFSLFLVHIYLNRTFLKQVIHNFSNHAVSLKPKLMLIISSTLFLCVTGIIITGLFISPNYAPLLGIDNFALWFPIHVSISCFTLLLVSVPVGLHWKAIFNVFKKGMGMVKTTRFQNIFLKGAALLIAMPVSVVWSKHK